MRVALYNLTTTVQTGGVEVFVWQLARHLRERGVDAHVVGGVGKINMSTIPSNYIHRYPYISRYLLRKLPLLDKHRRAISDYYHMELRRFVANEYNNDPALLDYINDIILLHKSKYLKKGGGISP